MSERLYPIAEPPEIHYGGVLFIEAKPGYHLNAEDIVAFVEAGSKQQMLPDGSFKELPYPARIVTRHNGSINVELTYQQFLKALTPDLIPGENRD